MSSAKASHSGKVGALFLGLIACASSAAGSIHPAARAPLAPGARYVAMGSSFAAGPGLQPEDPAKVDRCSRSTENYAHLLARKRRLNLIDVSCGGATTAHVLGRWSELPPQVDALDSATQLVTVTIGGNDIGYIGSLVSASCRRAPPGDWPCPSVPAPDSRAWDAAESGLRAIALEVRRRAPSARLIFVDYLTILPERRPCAVTPLSAAEADAIRAVARRLAALTARVAREAGAGLVRASALSRRHDACAKMPWMNGWVRPTPDRAPYHPNAAGMAAIAQALDGMISK